MGFLLGNASDRILGYRPSVRMNLRKFQIAPAANGAALYSASVVGYVLALHGLPLDTASFNQVVGEFVKDCLCPMCFVYIEKWDYVCPNGFCPCLVLSKIAPPSSHATVFVIIGI